VTSWCIFQQTNVSTPDLSPLQCRYKYYKDLTSQIDRSSTQDQVVKVNQEVMSLKLFK